MQAKRMQAKRKINYKIILIIISLLAFVGFLFLEPGIIREKNITTKTTISEINSTQKKIPESRQENIIKKVENSNTSLGANTINIEPVNIGLGLNSFDKVLGDRNAKVVMIEYSSPTCPHCSYYHKKIFPEIKKKYLDEKKIAYILRFFITNKIDLDAAIIPYCNYIKGEDMKFFNWFETILNTQENWFVRGNHLDHLITIGEIGGLPKESYQECLKDNNIISILIENNRAALEHKKFRAEPGTPAFFINGKKIEVPYSFENLSKALDEAISESEKNCKVDG